MLFVGGMELLLMLILGGDLRSDLVSFVEPAKYFKSRNIEVTIDKMVELATREPTDSKEQVMQLVALRQLANDAAEVKKAKDFSAILKQIEEVAQGKKGQDPNGFAAEYAQQTAQALGSQLKFEREGLPEGSALEGISWFPKSTTLVMCIDTRGGAEDGSPSAFAKALFALAPPQAEEQFYGFVEQLGNMRIDRFALAYTEAQNGRQDEIYMRITGKGDRKRLTEFIRSMSPQAAIKEEKNFRGKPITRISFGQNQPPAMAIIGDSEWLIAGPKDAGDSEAMIEKMLAVRNNKDKGARDGDLAADLKKTSPQAAGILVGKVPEELRRNLGQVAGVRVVPSQVIMELVRKKDDLHLQASTTFDTEDDARNLVENIKALQQMGLAQLKNAPPVPPGVPVPKDLFKKLTTTLESLKLEPKGKTVRASLTLSLELIQTFPAYLLGARFEGRDVPPPPPPPNNEVPKRE